MAGGFLVGDDLSQRIHLVIGGQNVHCAVAFWGQDAAQALFDTPVAALNAKIVCDISLGATSPDALSALGAPNKPNLRHLQRLHAKVYWSELGLVTVSANASNHGVGFGEATLSRYVEAATFHKAGSAPWKAAKAWLATIYKQAAKMDADAIELARKLYRPRLPGECRPRLPRLGSLLDAVCAAPERFEGVGFVFVQTASDAEAEARVKTSVIKLGKGNPRKINSWPRGDMFIGWKTAEVSVWPTMFFEFWQPRETLRVFARLVEVHVPAAGTVFTSKNLRALKNHLELDLPSLNIVNKVDASLSRRILDSHGDVAFLNTRSLIKAISILE